MSGGMLEALFNLHLLTHGESTITLILQFHKGGWQGEVTGLKTQLAQKQSSPGSLSPGGMGKYFIIGPPCLFRSMPLVLLLPLPGMPFFPIPPIDEIISFPFMTQMKSTIFLCSLFKHLHAYLFPTGSSP